MNAIKNCLLLAAAMAGLAGCVVTNSARLSTATENRPLVLPKDVALYRVASQVPRRYEEVALLNSSGDANYTNESKMFESMKKEAGKVGANGVILDALSEPGSGAKVAAAIFGVSAQRKGKALAIWVFPPDAVNTAPVPMALPQPISPQRPAVVAASSIRPFSYAGDPIQAVKLELSKVQCAEGIAVLSDTDGRKIYEATCAGGKRQLLECWSGACRTLN